MQRRTTPEGDTVYIPEDQAEIGSKAPFVPVYSRPDRSTRYGWFCTNCDGLETAMDTMGRIECVSCGNFRKPTEWDAAHE